MNTRIGLYGLPEPAPPPRPPSRWRWVRRVVIGAAVLLGLMMATLTMLGGNSDSLKEALENYISQSTGLRTEIDTLNAISFFPAMGIDVGGVRLTDSTGAVVVRAAHVNFSTGFWGAMGGRSNLRTFEVRGADIDPGVIVPGGVHIAHFGIDVTAPLRPLLVLRGAYDGHSVAGQAEIVRRVNVFGAPSFELSEPSALTLTIGDMALDAMLATGRSGQRTIDIASFTAGKGLAPLGGNLEFLRGLRRVGVKGQLKSGESAAVLDLRIQKTPTAWLVEGSAEGSYIDLGDLFAPAGVMDTLARIGTVYRAGREAGDSPKVALDLDLTVDIQQVTTPGFDFGAVDGLVSARAGDIQALLALGDLALESWDARLGVVASALPDSKACAAVRGSLNAGVLQGQFSIGDGDTVAAAGEGSLTPGRGTADLKIETQNHAVTVSVPFKNAAITARPKETPVLPAPVALDHERVFQGGHDCAPRGMQ